MNSVFKLRCRTILLPLPIEISEQLISKKIVKTEKNLPNIYNSLECIILTNMSLQRIDKEK